MKKYPLHHLLFGLCVVFILGLLQACTNPVSIDDEALDTESTASLQGADNSDNAGSTTNTSADPPNGDYTDPNRPGLVIICHIPSGDDATPVTLSIPPSALADYSTNAGDYDGPCVLEDQDDDVGSGDEGSDDQDDPNAAPIGNDEGEGSGDQGNDEGEGSGDQGSDDQDDANAAPVSGGNEEGNEAGTMNNGRGGSGG